MSDISNQVEAGLGNTKDKDWLKADVQNTTSSALTAEVEVGHEVYPGWAAYGHGWIQPETKKFGGEIGIRHGNLDLYVGAQGGATPGAEVGFVIHFK